MTQFQGPTRRSTGGGMDVYTVLALAGVFSLIVLAVTLWKAGGDLASTSNRSEMPWTILKN
jgi:hypothetical protein